MKAQKDIAMKIGVIGTGYVGLVHGIILAETGFDVLCMDICKEKIEKLKQSQVPIYEPGLNKLLSKNVKEKRIDFTISIESLVTECDVIFVTVATPEKEDGSADTTHIIEVAKDIAQYINCYKVIIHKSTVPVGTGETVRAIIQDGMEQRGLTIPFDLVSNPEFLREGKAIEDSLNPDRIVVGVDSDEASHVMRKVYEPFIQRNIPYIETSIKTAELIKYASNAFLAVKISYINEMALLADKVGADIITIAGAMGLDNRISKEFLKPGPGYGGSCFPKDTKAMIEIGKQCGMRMNVIEAAVKANEIQKEQMVERITSEMSTNNSLNGKRIAILGLSFKPETDDMRESPAIDIVKGLVDKGAYIQAFCPKGMKEAQWRLGDLKQSISYKNNEYAAISGADAIVIITDWDIFGLLNFSLIKDIMRDNYIFDLRNMYAEKKFLLEGYRYYGVGINS